VNSCFIPYNLLPSTHPTDMDEVIDYQWGVGILLCGSLREQLEILRFRGYEVTWHEGRGWFSRLWTIRAKRRTLLAIHNYLTEMEGDS